MDSLAALPAKPRDAANLCSRLCLAGSRAGAASSALIGAQASQAGTYAEAVLKAAHELSVLRS